jgi:hypothetical protein
MDGEIIGITLGGMAAVYVGIRYHPRGAAAEEVGSAVS